MVLSNKKLKQKLRANLAESEIQNNPTNSLTQHSLKSLFDSAIHKPRLSKREKRREKNDEDSAAAAAPNTSGGAEGDDEQAKPEEEKLKKNKKKRKREADENGDSEKLESKNDKTKKTKKKKKNKKKRKVGDAGEVKNIVESEVGVSGEQSVAELEAIKNNPSEEKVDASTKVYVGGIPYYSTEDDIRSFFESCGSITEIDCMKFPDSGKFRGIAIISFKTEAAAKRALELDGADMGGLFLKIELYKATRGHKPSDFSPAIIDGYNRIYIGNLSWDITEEDIRNFLSDFTLFSIRLGQDKETGQFKGFAHVDFADSLSVTMALKLDQKIICGRPARIRCAVPKKAATPASKSVMPAGGKDETKFVSAVERDDYVEMSEKVDNGGAVSGKIRRRTCYECGEKGHVSSDCPKKPPAEAIDSGENGRFEEMSEKVEYGVNVASGKIRRRTCYECGEKGHLSSDCPKKAVAEAIDSSEKGDLKEMSEKPVEMSEKVDNVGSASVASGKIRRRTCYECGEKGHLSSACPKKQVA